MQPSPSRTRVTQVTTTLVQPDNGILTSTQTGLGGTNEVRSIIEENMAAWGSCSTASEFYEKWFQSPREDLEAAGLLTEHFKQSDLGVACALNANAALENKERKFDKTNDKIAEYISKSGAWPAATNGIKTVRSLLDMMMITGVIHGACLLALSIRHPFYPCAQRPKPCPKPSPNSKKVPPSRSRGSL